ncbi:unnamed protein product, partial [Rotaria sp. Silwood1]
MFSSTMTFFYISLDKVKPIELNEEASVDTQNVSNTCLAHFETTHRLLECRADVLSNREHPSSSLWLIISRTYQHVLQTEDEASKITYRTAVIPYTELEFDIRKLESLDLSSQEERVPWIFFVTFSNQLQQLAKHVLREDYIFFYESANVDVA